LGYAALRSLYFLKVSTYVLIYKSRLEKTAFVF